MPRRSTRLTSSPPPASVKTTPGKTPQKDETSSSPSRRTSPRHKKQDVLSTPNNKDTKKTKPIDNDLTLSSSDSEPEEIQEQEEEEVYEFNGVQYDTYQDMVQAKRQRNQSILQASGLLDTAQQLKQQATKAKTASQRGLKRRQSTTPSEKRSSATRRKSNRLQGIASDGLYVEDERSGKFAIATTQDGGGGDVATSTTQNGTMNTTITSEPQFYGNRVNDGSDMTLQDAVTKHVGEKWLTDDSLVRAQGLCQELNPVKLASTPTTKSTTSTVTPPTSSTKPGGNVPEPSSTTMTQKIIPRCSLQHLRPLSDNPDPIFPSSQILDDLTVDSPDTQVAKVVPDRIYGMAVHPSLDQLVVCAGDKQGYIGLWKVPDEDNINATSNDNYDRDRVHLFKYHSGAAASLQWTWDGTSLFSTSYDGTCRFLDVTTETVRNVFATYDNDAHEKYANQPGYGLDEGHHRYWTQFGCLDHRQEECFFVSTSTGSVYHLDSRIAARGALTWQHDLSEKKINTVSLHPNGHSLATGGLDCQVYLWDIRKFGGNKVKPTPVTTYHGAKSINSAFFSPSGGTLVTTTMNNKLDLLEDFHLQKSTSKVVKPTHSIRHDNLTGRWLTTFQAVWHPRYEIFGVGCMARPRVVEIFGNAKRQRAIGGEALTAVASRLAFHPRMDRIILAGGNSSGRVTIIR